MFEVIALQVVVPVLLLLFFAAGSSTILNMAARAIIVISYLWAVRNSAHWLFLPWYGFYLYLAILAVIALIILLSGKHVPLVPRRRAFLRLQGEVVVALALININIYLLLGEAPNATFIVNLESPIIGRSVYVMNGGANRFVNKHLEGMDNPELIIPGNIYGVDLLVVNEHGRISDMMFPERSQDYIGYSNVVYSPCEGRVSRVSKDYSDQALSEDTSQILIECAGYEVQLSHMQADDLEVKVGNRVQAGSLLGRLGAVVKGEPPYLHMHVQRRIPQDSGEFLIQPVQVSIAGNFLARGDIVP